MRNKVDWVLRLFKTERPSRRGLLSIQPKKEENLNGKKTKYDMIGPVDKISNLRRYHFYVPADESRVEREYRLMREHVNEFNHLYWTEQNLRFVEAKRSFVEAHKRRTGGEEPSTGELNEFYRNFLNENYYNHYEYNQKWIRYNMGLLWPACKVFFYRLNKKILK